MYISVSSRSMWIWMCIYVHVEEHVHTSLLTAPSHFTPHSLRYPIPNLHNQWLNSNYIKDFLFNHPLLHPVSHTPHLIDTCQSYVSIYIYVCVCVGVCMHVHTCVSISWSTVFSPFFLFTHPDVLSSRVCLVSHITRNGHIHNFDLPLTFTEHVSSTYCRMCTCHMWILSTFCNPCVSYLSLSAYPSMCVY